MKNAVRLASVFTVAAIALVVMAVPTLAGTKSEAGLSVAVAPAPNPDPCEPDHISLVEVGEGVDTEYGAFDAEYWVCLDPGDLPSSWYVYNNSGILTFKTNPSDKVYVVADDHVQLINLQACVGTPEGGMVMGRVVGGEGKFEGARGHVRFNYGSPQSLCGRDENIVLWWTMYIDGPKMTEPAGE